MPFSPAKRVNEQNKNNSVRRESRAGPFLIFHLKKNRVAYPSRSERNFALLEFLLDKRDPRRAPCRHGQRNNYDGWKARINPEGTKLIAIPRTATLHRDRFAHNGTPRASPKITRKLMQKPLTTVLSDKYSAPRP